MITFRSMLVVVASVGLVMRCAAAANAALVGQWTFESASTADATGNWSTSTLFGSATVSGGQLNVTAGQVGSGGGWMEAVGYTGPSISQKTMVAWVSLGALSGATQPAGVFSLVKNGPLGSPGYDFDNIVYGERTAGQWAAGSDNFNRTPTNNGGAAETVAGGLVQIAITWDTGSQIKIYRNGALYMSPTSYTMGTLPTFTSSDSLNALFGRHSEFNPAQASYNMQIAEARIYNEVLTQSQIQALTLFVPVPEPSTFVLLGLGMVGVKFRSRRRRATA